MEQIQINKHKKLNYFTWDGEDNTILKIEEYIKEMKYDTFSVKRAYNDEKILCVSEKVDDWEMTVYCRINQCVVDVFKSENTLIVIDKKNVNQKFLSKW